MPTYRMYPGDIIVTCNEPATSNINELNDDEVITQSYLH
jgi:hypothetical protein